MNGKASQKQKIAGEQTYCDSVIQCSLLLKINQGLKLQQNMVLLKRVYI